MSAARNREWWVTGWQRPRPGSPEPEVREVTDTEGRSWHLVEREDPKHVDNGAQVVDGTTGVTYRATVKRTGKNGRHLTSLQIDAPPGLRIDSRFLASVPVERIADAVVQYLDATADAGPSDWVVLPPPAVQGRGFVPDLDELAARYTAPGVKRADVVAEYVREYGVSRATVDRWIAKARDAGLLPPADTGRPRKSPGGSGRRANREKGSK